MMAWIAGGLWIGVMGWYLRQLIRERRAWEQLRQRLLEPYRAELDDEKGVEAHDRNR